MGQVDSILMENHMKNEIPIEYLRSCFSYNAETGTFIWKDRPREHFKTDRGHRQTNGRQVGKEAFASPHSQGYLHGGLDGMLLFAHRVAWAIHYGRWPNGEIDHINHNRKDNRISNLREASRMANGRNLSIKSNNKTGANGVYVDTKHNRIVAQIRVNGKMQYIGAFASVPEALEARKKANEHYGFHENHGT